MGRYASFLWLAVALAAPRARPPTRLRSGRSGPCRTRVTRFAAVRVQDLKEELRQTGYRLAIAIHPAQPPGAKGEPPPRDLYLINADGTGLKQITHTPEIDERVPRTERETLPSPRIPGPSRARTAWSAEVRPATLVPRRPALCGRQVRRPSPDGGRGGA